MRGCMPVIPLECPSCGDELILDSDESAAICSSCGKPFVVKDAIVLNYIKLVTAKNADDELAVKEAFEIEDGVLIRYNGTFSEAAIPEGVTVIGNKAFEDCRDLLTVYFPESVETVEDNAFAGCGNLKTVRLTDSLKKIGKYAFSECISLKNIELPDNVEEIGAYAFSRCCQLSLVKMPSAKCDIHEKAFAGAENVVFEWPDDWKTKKLEKIRLVAPTIGGSIDLCGLSEDGKVPCDTILYMGTSDLGLSRQYHFYTYDSFMNLFSLGRNNNDPYLLRMSVEKARERYDDVADIQRSYSELISLLDRAGIGRSMAQMINIPHFIWKQGKHLNDYRIIDAGPAQVLQLKLNRN